MWLLAAIAGFVFYKAAKSRKQVDENNRDKQAVNNRRNNDSQLNNEGKTEAMLLCSACGVHLPASETQTRDGKIFCSDMHACGKKPA